MLFDVGCWWCGGVGIAVGGGSLAVVFFFGGGGDGHCVCGVFSVVVVACDFFSLRVGIDCRCRLID